MIRSVCDEDGWDLVKIREPTSETEKDNEDWTSKGVEWRKEEEQNHVVWERKEPRGHRRGEGGVIDD